MRELNEETPDEVTTLWTKASVARSALVSAVVCVGAVGDPVSAGDTDFTTLPVPVTDASASALPDVVKSAPNDIA